MDEISPMMNIFKDVVKIGCKTAIKISEKSNFLILYPNIGNPSNFHEDN